MDIKKRHIEYMCTICGKKEKRLKTAGRPQPGKCRKRSNNMPHRWVKNREVY